MNRRYTGAEARKLVEAKKNEDPRKLTVINAMPSDIALLAAAPDLAESLAAVEAERDEARAKIARYAPALERERDAARRERDEARVELDALRAKLHDAHVALAATAMGSDTTRTTIRDYLKALDEYNEIGDGAVVAEYEYALSTLREAAK